MEKIIILSNSVNRTFNNGVKTTAVREYENYQIISLLTSNDCDYEKLIKKIALISTNLFVDLEKKQPLDQKNINDQGGNLFKKIFMTIDKLGLKNDINLYPIKMNDLTVNATLEKLINIYEEISGLKLGLVGIGNIGSKLITQLTECGVKLKCFNRDIYKGSQIINSIVLTKPEHTIVSPELVRRIEHAFINTSGVILSCSNIDKDIYEYINFMQKNFNIFLIGHSLLKDKSLEKFKQSENVRIQRIDIGQELISFIIGRIKSYKYDVYGAGIYNKNNICSGGFLGNENDIIVDNFRNPNWAFGYCDGKGGAKYKNLKLKIKNTQEFDSMFN